MSQNALTLFCTRILEALRKLHISFLVVENEFVCKDEKVKEDEYKHCH